MDMRSGLSLRWLFVAWLSLAVVLLAFVVCGTVNQGDPTELIERVFGSAALFAMGAYVIGLIVTVLVLYSLLGRSGLGWQSVGLTGSFTKRAAAFAVIGWFIAFWLYYIVERTVAHAGIRMYWNESDFFRLDSVARVIVIAVGTVIIAPVAEEIIYRGYVLQSLLARMGTAAAVVLSALIFASVHVGIGPGLAIYIFFGSFIPAYLYLKFRNIYPCILMHLINNIVAYIIIPLAIARPPG